VAKKNKTQNRLLGWGILAAVAVVIVGLFLVSRIFTSSARPQQTVAAVAVATPTRAAASSAPPIPSAESHEANPSSQPAVQSPDASLAAPAAGEAETVAVIEPEAMNQGARKDMLLHLIDQGIFTAVKAIGSPPQVGVTPLFRGLSPSLQQQFIALVYLYINNGKPGSDQLQLIDVANGGLAGTYTTAGGLKLTGNTG
jgi:hypothetical protein